MLAERPIASFSDDQKNGFFFNKQLLYWLCQIGGWSFWGFYTLLLNGFTVQNGLDTLFTITGLLLLSHAYRYLIVQQGWLKYLFGKLLMRILLAAFILGILSIPISLLSMYIFNLENFEAIVAGEEDFLPILLQSGIVGTFLFFCWSVVYFLYHYVSSYNYNLKWEAQINEFELNRLRSQLNPHFIFNALNTVRALVDENPEKSKDSINQLSNILRSSLLMDRKKVITLSEEMAIVQDYLSLEGTRYEERLKVRMEIAEESLSFQVPPLMIQTLVENGIKHGISKLKDGGEIVVKTWVEAEKLQCMISNTGYFNPGQPQPQSGYGLRSTHQRLKLLFRGKAKLEIGNDGAGKVVTKISLPKWDESQPTVVANV